MNEHHQVALAAANRWADAQPKPCGKEQAIAYGIEFANVYEAAMWEQNRTAKPSIWQKLGFA